MELFSVRETTTTATAAYDDEDNNSNNNNAVQNTNKTRQNKTPWLSVR
jgi:hypothetical protein